MKLIFCFPEVFGGTDYIKVAYGIALATLNSCDPFHTAGSQSQMFGSIFKKYRYNCWKRILRRGVFWSGHVSLKGEGLTGGLSDSLSG